MAADDADEKKPEVDPWADIMAEDLGGLSENLGAENLGNGDGLGEGDDASAFDFLDGDDDAAASDAAASDVAAADFPAAEFPASGPPGDELPIGEPAAGALAAGELPVGELSADLTDELAQELFAEADEEADLAAGAPPLSVFAPEESAVSEPSPSTIEIGTGLSGIRLDEAEAAEEEAFAQAAGDESDFFASAGLDEAEEAAEDAEATGEDLFTAAAPAVGAAVTAPAAARVTTAKAAAKKKGGIGQMIGVVLGGLMSIPIVLGILIGLMWAGWPDTLGLRKSMPAALSFLLPPKQPSGLAKLPTMTPDAGTPDTGLDAGGSALDDLAVTDAVDTTDGAGSDALGGDALGGDALGGDALGGDALGGDALGGDRPAPVEAFAAAGTLPGIDALPGDEPLPAASDDPFGSPPAAPSSGEEDDATPDGSIPASEALAALGTRPVPLDDFDAAVLGGEPATVRPEPAAVEEPEPLDMASLEAAVLAADEASAAVAAIDDLEDRGSRRRLIEWYRSLAHVAAELALLERVAADSARPLAKAPDPVVDLHATIAADGRLVDQLGRLAPMWLAFDKRDSDGVMLVGEFSSTRPAGPWWRSRVIHSDGEGTPRDLTVITRSEPAAVAGEPVFVTGVIIGDDVVWGTDCRAARPSDSPRPEPDDIFGLPE